MNNSLRNTGCLASNFPVDCQIPHLENNPYIYGGGPPFKPHPCRYSPQKYVPATEKMHQQDFGYSEVYSNLNTKGLRSTNPYSTGFGSSSSPSKDKIPSFENEKRAETLKSSARKEQALYRTPRNEEKNLKYEEVEKNIDYLKPNERSAGVSYRSKDGMRGKQSARNTERDKMEEFHLISSGYKDQVPRPDEARVQELHRKEQLLRENELEERRQLEDDERRRRHYWESVEDERKRDREHQERYGAMIREQEENYRQEQLKSKEHSEYLERDRRQRWEAFMEHDPKRAKQLDILKPSSNIKTPYSQKSSNTENHEALKQQIGRESRQFYREKQMKNSPFKTPEHRQDHFSPQSNPVENNFSETKSQQRGSSSKASNNKMKSLSNKKNDAHHFQHTFSSKVKSMVNQPYTFANSTKSTVSRQS